MNKFLLICFALCITTVFATRPDIGFAGFHVGGTGFVNQLIHADGNRTLQQEIIDQSIIDYRRGLDQNIRRASQTHNPNQPLLNKLALIKKVVFPRGSGTQAYSLLGALEVLEQYSTFQPDSLFGGSAVSALIAACWRNGWNATELIPVFISTDGTPRPLDTVVDFLLGPGHGMFDVSDLETLVNTLIYVKTGNPAMTFAQSPGNITIVAYDLTNQRTVYFSKHSTPDVTLARAVLYSSSAFMLYVASADAEGNYYLDPSMVPNQDMLYYNVPNNQLIGFNYEMTYDAQNLSDITRFYLAGYKMTNPNLFTTDGYHPGVAARVVMITIPDYCGVWEHFLQVVQQFAIDAAGSFYMTNWLDNLVPNARRFFSY